MELELSAHSPTRHGDVVFQVISSFVAQSVDLSAWQDVQAFGILYLSVIVGDTNLKVCELTNERQGQRFVISPLWRRVKSQGCSNCLVWKSTGGVHKTIACIQIRDKGDEHQVHRRVLAERYGDTLPNGLSTSRGGRLLNRNS
jgi:hypothetical protein